MTKKTTPASAPAQTASKIARMFALLQRKQGAIIAEMVEATDGQPHATRAALTELKKKGHGIEREKRYDVTCCRIAADT